MTNDEMKSRYPELSTRAAYCLANAHIKSREQAKQAILEGRLKPDKKPWKFGMADSDRGVRNYGWKTHKEVCKWAGIPEPKEKKKEPISSVDELANRIAAAILTVGGSGESVLCTRAVMMKGRYPNHERNMGGRNAASIAFVIKEHLLAAGFPK